MIVTQVDASEAQPDPSLLSNAVSDFPEGITFSLDLPAAKPPERIELLYRVANDDTLHLALPEMDVAGDRVHAEESIDLQAQYLPAGLDLHYFWRLFDAGGASTDTPQQSVSWRDDRFDWRPLRSEQVVLYIHDVSDGFGYDVLTTAQATVDELETALGASLSKPIVIWLYSTTEALLGAQQANTRESIAGAAFLEYGLITTAVPENDQRELRRLVPHEVSHLMLHQATENPFGSLPLWLDEGLAVHMQTAGKENYPRAVQQALTDDRLFELASLAATFPFDSEGAYLAYAQSLSAVTFLFDRYGQEGVARLIDRLGDGLSTDQAMLDALGIDLANFERDWRASLQTQTGQTAAVRGALSNERTREAA